MFSFINFEFSEITTLYRPKYACCELLTLIKIIAHCKTYITWLWSYFSICFSALCLYFHWRLHRTQCGCSVRFQCHFITPITQGNHIVRQVLACQHLQSGPAGWCTPRSDFSKNCTVLMIQDETIIIPEQNLKSY